MRSEKPYRYECPECGHDVYTDAKYRARLRYSCLSCIRKSTGWKPRHEASA